MKCPRCEKEFIFEFQSIEHWLRASALDNQQLSFLLYNYGAPLCEDCETDLRDCFYSSGVNPKLKKSINH